MVGHDDKMTPETLRGTIAIEETRGVHGPQRGPVSITQVSERGQVHSLSELAALTNVAKEFDLPVFLDGARFSNALVSLGCTPAEMTWKLGVDALSFGGTKNGCMGVEAVIIFDPQKAWEFELRRKRGAHLFSKHRYLSAQMQGYLADGLWRRLASDANAACARLIDGLRKVDGIELPYASGANMVFADMPRKLHQKLHNAGAMYYITQGVLEGDDPEEMLTGRFVCDWSIDDAKIDEFLSILDV